MDATQLRVDPRCVAIARCYEPQLTMSMSIQQPGNDLQQPLYTGRVTLPISPQQSKSSSGYYPPSLEINNAFSAKSSPSKTSNMMNDDERFIGIAAVLMEAHESRNLRIEDAIETTFRLPGQAKVFLDALHFRMSKLPMFPEAGETSTNKMIREVEHKFGRALRVVSTRMPASIHSTSHLSVHLLPPIDTRSPLSSLDDAFNTSPRVQPVTSILPQSTTMSSSQMHSKSDTRVQCTIPHSSPVKTHEIREQHGQQQPGTFQCATQVNLPVNNPERVPVHHVPSNEFVNQANMNQPIPTNQFPHQVQYTTTQGQPQSQPHTQQSLPSIHEQQKKTQSQQAPTQAQLSQSQIHQPHLWSSQPQLMAHPLQPRELEEVQAVIQYCHHPDVQGRQPKYQPPSQTPTLVANQSFSTQARPQFTMPQSRKYMPSPQGLSLPTNVDVLHSRHGNFESQTPFQSFTHQPLRHGNSPVVTTAQHYHQYRPPEIIIDWNIPLRVKEVGIDLSTHNSPKSHVRGTESKKERTPSPNKKPTSPSSIKSDPTIVVSNRSKPCEKFFDAFETRGNENDPTVKCEGEIGEREVRKMKENSVNESVGDQSMEKALSSGLVTTSNFKLDIARSKNEILFNQAKTLQNHTVMKKELMNEVDRINHRMLETTMEEEKDAYITYLNELQVEIDKWNTAANFGIDSISSVGKEKITVTKPPPVDEIRDFASQGTDKVTLETLEQNGDFKNDDRATGDTFKYRQYKRGQMRGTKYDKAPSDVRRQWRVANVEAPNTLPEGFKFEARTGDEVFIATVPRGGVKFGEIFSTRMGDIYGDEEDAAERTRVYKDMDAPPSRWRDDLFDCFRHGVDHPFLCNTIFCPLIALHQILTRIQMDGTGDRLVTLKSRTRVYFVVWLVFLLVFVHVLYFAYFSLATPDDDVILITTMPLIGMDVLLLLYKIYIVAKTRRQVRREYDIPALRCKGNEDCCMAVFCTCCTIAQMGRHTADYETYRAYCCSDTGLANHIEVKLPVEACLERGDDQDSSNVVTSTKTRN